ncbi:uncharacterized protein [Mytilus edulis]|uniref:uncharacterized protein n=1 Tax=Mytilus edulis TaxID=6550 RepID=UPI0039EFC9CE
MGVGKSEDLFRLPDDFYVDKWTDSTLNPKSSNVLSCDSDNSYEVVQPSYCSRNYSKSIPATVNKTVQITSPGTQVKYSQIEAKSFCEKKIKQTDAFQECRDGLQGIDWDHFYEMCWHDIILTDSTMWADQTVRAVLERCVVEVKNKDKDESHNTSTVNPIKTPNLDKLCPDDCNKQGTCMNAICTCNAQFLGIDCSVSIANPPMITELVGLKNGGHTWCDKTKASCNSFIMYGHEIEQSGSLTCKIEKYLAMSDHTYLNVSTHIVNAIVESLSEVHCSLTGEITGVTINHTGLYVEEYRISLSYNNRNYSHPLKLRVFNGDCHEIYHKTRTNVVGLANATCFINGDCFPQGRKDTHNEFMICNPANNTLKWTFDSEHNCMINGTFYHHKDKDATLQCLSCNPEVSSTNWTLVGECLINGVCFTDISNSPFDEMYICNSSFSTSEWSMNHTIPVPDIRVHVSSISVKETYELECHLDTSRMNYTYYNITWMWGNKSLKFQNTFDNLQLMRLPGYLVAHLGTIVYCIIEGQYELNEVLTTFNSKEFYVGIQTESHVGIEKGGTAQLRYWLTAPFLCNNCIIHLTIVDTVALGVHNIDNCDGDIVIISQTMDGCDFETANTNWNMSKSIPLKHRPNRQYGVQLDTFLIKLRATISNTNLTAVDVPDIKVQVVQHHTEWHSKVCSAYTDPHMTTFDGLHYEHQQGGTYTMYRNKQQNMEVQIQLTTCYSDKAFCACGIAVRAGADVFIINFCDGWSVIQYAACEYAPVLHVSKMTSNNQHYKIVFPTGTAISVKIAPVNPINLLDIEIRPSSDDFNNSEGLCGTLTNNCSDDFRLRNGNSVMVSASCHNSLYSFAKADFSHSWKVPQGDDLFSLSENSLLTVWHSTDNYCKCNLGDNGTLSERCGNNSFPSVYCTDSGYEPIVTKCRNNVAPGNYAKTIPITKDENHVTKPQYVHEHELSLNESIGYCKKQLNSKEAFRLCSEINNIPSQHFEEICAVDVYLSHTYLWTSQIYETLKHRCLQEINLNNTLQTTKTNEGKSFPDIRGNQLCPGFEKNCNGNGDCLNGICNCHSGYISPDCSISIKTVPSVDHIQNNGLCDTSKGACTTLHIYGHIIYQANMIFCKIQTFYMFKDKTFKYGSDRLVGGKITSLIEIECQIPTELLIEQKFTSFIARGHTVNVGYNGSSFRTKTIKYFEFDPKCQIPTGAEEDRFFKIANSTCFVNGKCYSDMQINPMISYEYCDPHRKQQEWSFNETSVCKIDGHYVPKSNLTSNNECQSCDPEKSVYNWTVVDNECFINYTCYSLNDRNPQKDEEYCEPLKSQISWSFNESVLVPHVRAALLKVHQTNMNVDVERLYFECVMDFSKLFYKFYEVKWTWGRNQTLILKSGVNNMKNLWLTETHFHSLGTNISCTLRGKHSPEDQNGTVFTCQPFFAGIYITELMTVQKGGSAEISYNLSVPFGCLSFNNRTLPCFIELNMLSPDYTTSDQCYGDIVNLEHCRVKIWRDSWSSPRKLAIKHRGRQMYGVYPVQISMKLKTSSADHPLWDTTKIPEIKVHVHDSKVELQERVCSAYNVHFTTFDGLHYVQPNQGTFTMYNNRLKERNMMVQVKLTQCDETRGVHCICGVAVRAGGDVYVFDFCDGKSIIQYMSCQQKLLDVTTRSKDNKKYKITFPTGTEVAVNIQYIGTNTFMDVEIRASKTDLNMTEGLCGTLNDKCDDDLTETDGKFSPVTCSDAILDTISQKFSDSWRVSGSNDLFNISNGEQIALWTNHDEYCSCPSAAISDHFECSARSTVPCSNKNDYKTIGQSTCKLSSVEDFNLPTKNRTYLNSMIFQPELVNISSSGALSLCREAIENNTAFQACAVVPNMPSEYFIQICGFEVEKSKSRAWIRHTVNSMKSRCLSEVQKNETLKDQTSEDIPSITETVIMAICPGLPECSGNGKCDHGLCVCNEGFMSHDCSMTKTVPPEIYGVRGNGICDRNEINCDTAFVVGSRIEESDELSCKISKYVIHPDGSNSFEGTTIVSGNVETLVEVHCPLKTSKQKRSVRNTGNILFVEVFDVSVSYNREDFSDPERVILMNSKCQQNNGTTTDPNFVLKDDTCFIDNQCLLDLEPNSQQEYLYCNAPTDRYKWTFDDSENCKVEEQYFSRDNMIFNKECLLCNPDITSYNWTLKENYCLIDGDCVSHNQKNTVDECLFCDTVNNLFEWTKHDEVCIIKVDKPSNAEKSSSKLGLILLGSIGSVVILFIVGFIVNCYVKNNNSRLKRKSTYEADDHYAMRRLPRMKVNN